MAYDSSIIRSTRTGGTWANFASLPTATQMQSLPVGIKAYTDDGQEWTWNGSVWLQLTSTGGGIAPVFSNLYIVGDSQSVTTAVVGDVTVVANLWPNRLATLLGLTASFGGKTGGRLWDFWTSDATTANFYDQVLSSNSLVASLAGYNNLNGASGINGANMTAPTGAYFLSDWALEVYGFFSWCGMPDALKQRFVLPGTTTQNPAVTVTGAWTFGTGTYPARYGFAGNGATATFTVTGDTVRLWYARYQTASDVKYQITIDGTLQTIVGAALQNSSYVANSYAFSCATITGLSNTQHTMKVTIVSSGSSGLLFGAGGHQIKGSAVPTVLVGGCQRLNSTGYGAGTVNNPGAITAPAVSVLGDGGVANFNRVTRDVLSQLRADGLQTYWIDTNMGYDVGTHLSADNVHPNDYGMAFIARRMFQALQSRQLL